MVTQKQISLKVDIHLFEELDAECQATSRKRNWVINRAIHTYLTLQDSRRLVKCLGSDENKKSVLYSWLHDEFPEAATW